MIDKSDFNRIIKKIDGFYQKRETIIRESRNMLRNSKQAIFCVHRGDFKKAKALLDEAGKSMKKVETSINKETKLAETGAFNAAQEEYAEAVSFYFFMKSGRIPTLKEVGVNEESYLMGLCDLTGELGREAVIAATKKDKKLVDKIRKAVDELYGEFIKLNITNNELRKKTDSIKWNLKKIEEVYYDLAK